MRALDRGLPHLSCISSSCSWAAAADVLRCLGGLELSSPKDGPEQACTHMAIKHSTASISIGSSSGTLSRLKKLGGIWALIHLIQQGDSYHSRQDMQMSNRPAHTNMSGKSEQHQM